MWTRNQVHIKEYLWFGAGSEPIEREIAIQTAKFLRKGKDANSVTVEEGNENSEFWKLLGGKKDYASSSMLRSRDMMANKPPRLFHCWNAKGYFDLEEIHNFTQDDLLLEDIYILDVYNSVFVWVGTEANSEEKLKSMETAIKYVERASKVDGRQVEQPIIKVLAGEEPPIFTCWFHAWEPFQSGVDIFKQFVIDQQKKQLEKEKQGGGALLDVRAEMEQIRKAQNAIYPYERIRLDVNRRNLPPNVDAKILEKYLSDEEFGNLFQMKREEFHNLPTWKQESVKSKLQLW